MPTFVMPQLGESDVEGTVLKWLKRPGEFVRADEPLVEVETEKVNVEIPSPFEGTLTQILVPEGETVPVGAELAIIAAAEEAIAAAGAPTTGDGAARAPAAAPPAARPPAEAVDRAARDGQGGPGAPAGRAGPGRYSPAVLRLAAEHGLDLGAIRGTGLEGRVTRKDVLRFIESGGAAAVAAPARAEPSAAAPAARVQPPPASPAPPVPPAPAAATAPEAGADEEVIKPSPTRLTIARNMLRVWQTVPVAWMVVEVDLTRLVRLRESVREEFRRREGVDLSYLPFAIKATVEALKEHPLLNSQWRDDHIVLKKRIHIGVAVATDEGLIVPVVHDADRLSIAGLAHAVADLAARARARKLRLEDVQGGTFTIDNTGVFGSVVSQPILNPPQCAILTTEAVTRRPVVVEDGFAVRSLMNMCISFDHRIVDGSHVGPFMQSVKRRLESFGPDTPIY
jgi:2-oxoisovalerate dehydrogenase E2 component (dihydrolipoyl transacylase)